MKNVTVKMPLKDFDELRANQKNKTEDEALLMANIDYINDLIEEVAAGAVEPDGFYFFETAMGKVILENINLFKAEQ